MTMRHGLLFALFALLSASLACQRTPEDVERWRNAQKGMKKMQKWATSSSEPMDVRVRAMTIIIEENNPTLIKSTLEDVQDDKARSKLVQASVDTVLELWEKGNPPSPSEKQKNKGGRMKLDPNEPATVAKDSAYYLIPFTEGENKEKLQNVLAEWLASDWKIRNKAGKTNLGQLVTRAGSKGLQNALKWLESSDEPHDVASTLRRNTDESQKKEIAKTLKKLAEKNHPDLSDSLLTAVVKTKHEAIVPYLKKAANDPESSEKLTDQSLEAIKRIQGERATGFLSKFVKEHPGKARWWAVNDIIKIRGKAGILTAASSLPLDKEQYEKVAEDWESFKSNAEWFANFTVGEMIANDVSTIAPTLIRALESDRWPVQVLGLVTASRAALCATEAKACGNNEEQASKTQDVIGDQWDDVVSAVKNLTSSRESIPAWGEEKKRLGELAHEVANQMEKKGDK